MDVSFTYNFLLENGNYNIQEFQDTINTICASHINIQYDTKKNKWLYISKADINSDVWIMPTAYNSKYFGLTENSWNLISYAGGEYSKQINMNNFSLIVIKILGLVELDKSIDNFNSSLSSGETSCIIPRQDTAVGALINWYDYSKSFIKKISNPEINMLTFQFYNEYNNLLLELNDWIIVINITIKKKLNYKQLSY